jgi:DtxR family Mn-dependent transcriptional regulator
VAKYLAATAMLPSSTVENYLKAIYLGVASLAPPQRLMPMGQLASALGVAPGTATTMVKTLAESGLARYEPYAGVALTPSGRKLAALVLRRHRLIELFLVRVMGYSWDEVHEEAEQLEHVVSDRLIERIDEMLGRPEVDPHGDPIPTADGLMKQQPSETLLTCPLKTPVRVTRVMDQDAAFLRFIENHNLKPGQSIEVEHRDTASDSVRVRGKNDERITIGTRAASKLLVHVARVIAILLTGAGIALAQPSSDSDVARTKRQFTLFHPTTRELMRELSADRPDRTDTPITVDTGHVQVEMDFANLTVDSVAAGNGRIRSTAGEVIPVNVKLGVFNNVDVQLVSTMYRRERIRVAGEAVSDREDWFEGITPRVKVNLVGNDGGPFALALIPFISVPLGSEDQSKEFGVAIPYSFDVPGWEVGLQTAIRAANDEIGADRHAEFDNSLSVGRTIAGKLSLYGEVFTSISREPGAAWIGTTNTWLTYDVSGNLRIDGGVYIGITESADDWHPWLGMTWRY